VNRLHSIAALAALVVALASAPSAASAQTRADAFAGKIPPVSGQLYQKAGRLEVTPSLDLSLNDAFFSKYFGGLEVGYHATESWSISASASGGLGWFLSGPTRSGSAVRCDQSTGCTSASETELRQVPGRIRQMGGLQLAWAPVYGKLNVLADAVAHFDVSILGGVDLIRRDEILSAADAAALDVAGTNPKQVMTLGFHGGLGARLFISQALSLRLVVKDVVYSAKVPNNGPGQDWQNQLFTEIGLSIFFPTQNRPQR
jgi:outer membrane beta-barrel protein